MTVTPLRISMQRWMFVALRGSAIRARGIHTSVSDVHASKYAEKLQRKAEEKGLSLTELRARIKAEDAEKRHQQRASQTSFNPSKVKTQAAKKPSVRQDSSPVKPLSTVLNMPKILSATPAQVSALWTAYHASRSDGTGRGYLCATIPLDLYQKMALVGSKYPSFVLPLMRPTEQGKPDAYEFYYLQWAFHDVPPVPSSTEDPFSVREVSSSECPPLSTVLFTPLQEYKLRTTFATPYLVLTNYTDLARSHGIVLLRGEITPSSVTSGYFLSQEDAQALSMGLQKFYLWERNDTDDPKEQLVRLFHENPSHFKWEELIKHASLSS